MKAGAVVLALLWFAAATYAGYRLTARSFAWVDEPNFGLPVQTFELKIPVAIPEAYKDALPPAVAQQAAKLSPTQLLCLQAAIAPDRVQAALKGDLTPAEAAAAKKCLE